MSAIAPGLVVPALGNYSTIGSPRILPFVCNDNINTVTAAGYINQFINQAQVLATDVFLIAYSDGVNFFKTSISSGVITLTIDTNIAPGSITTAMIADGAVTTAKIASGNITSGLIAANAITTALIATGNVTLATLAVGITPSHVVKFAGTATYAGGGTSSTVAVAGVLSSDLVVATLSGATTLVPFKAVATTDTITFTYSANPGAGTTITYSVLRAAS